MKSRACMRFFGGAAALGCAALSIMASSHREAPLITQSPKLDGTDFYIFNSYEPGRSNFVTMVANYIPLQDAYGGPNFFSLDPDGLYEIHIDNNGDAIEDLTFQFKFSNTLRNISLPIGPVGNRRTNAVPVLAVGQIGSNNIAALNLDQTYTINLIHGPRRTGTSDPVKNAKDGSTTFTKPLDNVGMKTIPDYSAYADSYMYDISIPGHSTTGRVFVGQRKDPFVVNLGETFDLINISTSPLGPVDANKDILADKNVTAIILEVPKEWLLSAPGNPIIGAWTTASKITTNSSGQVITQVSRLGHPLVNEVVIGVKDKDTFNASEPKGDGQFADYVTHPTLPAIIELLFGSVGVKAPTLFPRTDLVAVFLTGVDGLNKNGSLAEMMRLNTSTPAVAPAQQNNLGVIGGDVAGFPNGRRPGDDVVDIALRVVMGALLSTNDAPSGKLPFTDGAFVNAAMFAPAFPYLNPPLAGSPNDPTVTLTLKAAATVNGIYKGVPATYDPASKTLNTAKPAADKAFFKTQSENHIGLGSVSVNNQNNTVQIGVK